MPLLILWLRREARLRWPALLALIPGHRATRLHAGSLLREE
jgi:hypothetical protein